MHNRYKGDAAKLGEWKSASHVERTDYKAGKNTPPPPTPTTPPANP